MGQPVSPGIWARSFLRSGGMRAGAAGASVGASVSDVIARALLPERRADATTPGTARQSATASQWRDHDKARPIGKIVANASLPARSAVCIRIRPLRHRTEQRAFV